MMLGPTLTEKLQKVRENLDYYDQLFSEPAPIITTDNKTTAYRCQHGELLIHGACQKCVNHQPLITTKEGHTR